MSARSPNCRPDNWRGADGLLSLFNANSICSNGSDMTHKSLTFRHLPYATRWFECLSSLGIIWCDDFCRTVRASFILPFETIHAIHVTFTLSIALSAITMPLPNWNLFAKYFVYRVSHRPLNRILCRMVSFVETIEDSEWAEYVVTAVALMWFSAFIFMPRMSYVVRVSE